MSANTFFGSLSAEKLPLHRNAIRHVYAPQLIAQGRIRCGSCRRVAREKQSNRDYACRLTRRDGMIVPAIIECKTDYSAYRNLALEVLGGVYLHRLPASLQASARYAPIGTDAWTDAQSFISELAESGLGEGDNPGLLLSDLPPNTILSYCFAQQDGPPCSLREEPSLKGTSHQPSAEERSAGAARCYLLSARALQRLVMQRRNDFAVLLGPIQTWAPVPFRSLMLRVPLQWVLAEGPEMILAAT